jgi:predicted mannosyl-3-phosphoglycerate phosphatase (HAD superfamily)
MTNKKVFVTVTLEVPDGVEDYELVENCDYAFSYDGKNVESEIVEVYNSSDQRLF